MVVSFRNQKNIHACIQGIYRVFHFESGEGFRIWVENEVDYFSGEHPHELRLGAGSAAVHGVRRKTFFLLMEIFSWEKFTFGTVRSDLRQISKNFPSVVREDFFSFQFDPGGSFRRIPNIVREARTTLKFLKPGEIEDVDPVLSVP